MKRLTPSAFCGILFYTTYNRGECVDISFPDRKLQKICNDRRRLIAEYGEQNGKKIMLRLTELSLADNLAEIPTTPPPRRHQLKNYRKGQFAVDIKDPFRIVFTPNHDPIPLLSDGGIDIEKVTRINVIWIGDYHDE